MDSFTATTSKVEDIVPTVNEDDGGGSSGSCVICKEDTSLPPTNHDGEFPTHNPQRHRNWHTHHSFLALDDEHTGTISRAYGSVRLPY
ncbi:hypothetical protein C8F04DRAFT_1249386 [Mycena alexandri]|uniref:Uncharacterized protein n=1 Tax=Mycena alexandri TaxID=1745969 RepID=A0AAD6TGU0_9AGAR|nr:hypothetical protein C8F04DRAFT_1249386 [Mycena alexandri]